MEEQEVTRAITTISAVILGFCLGQISDWIKSTKALRKKEKSLRQLITLEIENNVLEIKHYWNKVLGSSDSWETEDGDFRFVQLAEEAANNPFPFLSTDVWKANLGEIASVYSVTELNKLWYFQKNLERLSSLYIFFSEAKDERNETNRFHDVNNGAGIGDIISMYDFSDSIREYAPEYKSLVEKIITFKCNV